MHFSRSACLFRCSLTHCAFCYLLRAIFILLLTISHTVGASEAAKSHFKQLNCAINNFICALYGFTDDILLQTIDADIRARIPSVHFILSHFN
jgi:hypothetical protein